MYVSWLESESDFLQKNGLVDTSQSKKTRVSLCKSMPKKNKAETAGHYPRAKEPIKGKKCKEQRESSVVTESRLELEPDSSTAVLENL